MTSESATAVENPPAEPAREVQETVIKPPEGWQALHWADVWAHRHLIYFITWRDLKVRYKQTALGAVWAIIQPVLLMVVFAMVFGEKKGDKTQDLPYAVFLYAGLLPWTFVSQAVSKAAMSLVAAERLIEKVYFPRLVIPIAAVVGALFDFAIASAVLGLMIIWYRIPLSFEILLLPVAVFLLCLVSLAVGILYASLNITYRDFRHLLTFVMQIWLFATPTIYDPAFYDKEASQQTARSNLMAVAKSAVGKSAQADESENAAEDAKKVTDSNAAQSEPQAASESIWKSLTRKVNVLLKELPKYIAVQDLNPLTAVIAFFQAVVLGTHLPWMKVAKATLFSSIVLCLGLAYFRRVEGRFADII